MCAMGALSTPARPVSVARSSTSADERASIFLEFHPVDRGVHHVRLMVLSFVQLATNDHAFASRATVACAELADCFARKIVRRPCALRLVLDAETLRVEVSAEGSEESVRALEQAIASTLPGTPNEAYTRALIANGPDSAMLIGLARVRYEAQLRLGCHREGRRLVVTATT